MNDERELTTQETLRLLADIIDTEKVAVHITAQFLRDVANELDEAQNEVIEITLEEGSCVLYEGKQAKDLIKIAVENLINEAIRRELERLKVAGEI